MSIDDVRSLLVCWGRYWRSVNERQSGGYASVSVTERCCEVLRTGVWVSSDKHLFSHQSESIIIPAWLVPIDDAVKKLSKENAAVINLAYIKTQKLDRKRFKPLRLLLTAETELMACL